jgi:hypothetical protein
MVLLEPDTQRVDGDLGQSQFGNVPVDIDTRVTLAI